MSREGELQGEASMRDIHVKASRGKLLVIAGFALAAKVGPAGADVITD